MLPPLPDTDFWQAYQRDFQGLLHWPDVEAFWQLLAATPQGWYLFDPTSTAPDTPIDTKQFPAILTEIKTLIHSGRKTSHCFALFTDDRLSPNFVKIFDPANLGATCGSSGTRTLPHWTLSRTQPDTLPQEPVTPVNSGFFNRLVKRTA